MTSEELNHLISEYGKHVYSFCCNLTGNRIDADDLYQDTILKAVELRHRLDGSGNPKSFLMGISVKLWQNQKKKYAVRNRIIQFEELNDDFIPMEEDMNGQPEAEAIRRETIQAVRTGIGKLPYKLQIALYLYYTAEMSVEEIGRALHIPSGTVKSRLHKGRNSLKLYLEVLDHE